MGKRGPKAGAENAGRPIYWTDEVIEEVGQDLVEFAMQPHAHSISQFCREYDKHPANSSLISRWENENFIQNKKKAQDCFASNLSEGMLNGTFPPAAAIFTLKNVVGWRDKPPEQTQEENSGVAALLSRLRDES
jgi:hypothetical protein